MNNIAFQLQELKLDLQRLECIKGSAVEGRDFRARKADLEVKFYNLRLKLIDDQIKELETARETLEKNFAEGKRIW